MELTIIGVDCAVDPRKVGLATAHTRNDRCVVDEVAPPGSVRDPAAWITERLSSTRPTLLALDSPLGWPAPLAGALTAHRAGGPVAVEPHQLFRRETDRVVKVHLGRQTLDVGADRIARTAVAALGILCDVRERTAHAVPLAWAPEELAAVSAIEVYPAGTLLAHGLPASGYKKTEQLPVRRAIIDGLRRMGDLEVPEDQVRYLEANADALDAVVCILAGLDFAKGLSLVPSEVQEALALREGWIWFREG